MPRQTNNAGSITRGKFIDPSSGERVWKRGMSIAEISDITGMCQNTVKRVLYGAIKKMRKSMAAQPRAAA
jgi:hypothetical protein